MLSAQENQKKLIVFDFDGSISPGNLHDFLMGYSNVNAPEFLKIKNADGSLKDPNLWDQESIQNLWNLVLEKKMNTQTGDEGEWANIFLTLVDKGYNVAIASFSEFGPIIKVFMEKVVFKDLSEEDRKKCLEAIHIEAWMPDNPNTDNKNGHIKKIMKEKHLGKDGEDFSIVTLADDSERHIKGLPKEAVGIQLYRGGDNNPQKVKKGLERTLDISFARSPEIQNQSTVASQKSETQEPKPVQPIQTQPPPTSTKPQPNPTPSTQSPPQSNGTRNIFGRLKIKFGLKDPTPSPVHYQQVTASSDPKQNAVSQMQKIWIDAVASSSESISKNLLNKLNFAEGNAKSIVTPFSKNKANAELHQKILVDYIEKELGEDRAKLLNIIKINKKDGNYQVKISETDALFFDGKIRGKNIQQQSDNQKTVIEKSEKPDISQGSNQEPVSLMQKIWNDALSSALHVNKTWLNSRLNFERVNAHSSSASGRFIATPFFKTKREAELCQKILVEYIKQYLNEKESEEFNKIKIHQTNAGYQVKISETDALFFDEKIRGKNIQQQSDNKKAEIEKSEKPDISQESNQGPVSQMQAIWDDAIKGIPITYKNQHLIAGLTSNENFPAANGWQQSKDQQFIKAPGLVKDQVELCKEILENYLKKYLSEGSVKEVMGKIVSPKKDGAIKIPIEIVKRLHEEINLKKNEEKTEDEGRSNRSHP